MKDETEVMEKNLLEKKLEKYFGHLFRIFKPK